MRKQLVTQNGFNRLLRLSFKLFLSLSLSMSFIVANAQDDEETPLNISGSIDTYWRTTLNTDDNGPSRAPATSFAGQTGFNIGMANVIVGMEGKKSGFVADLVFGPRGDEAVFGSVLPGNNDGIVNQLYAYYMPADNLTFTVGNFNTFLGYEVISPAVNFNYSTSYMFSYGPFSHTGLKADVGLSDNLSMMLGVFNATDATTMPFVNDGVPAYVTGTYTLGFQLGYENDMGGAWLNVLAGDQDGSINTDQVPDTTGFSASSMGWLFQIDLTTGWDLSDAFYLGLNATYNQTALGTNYMGTADGIEEEDMEGDAPAFMGAAVYAQYALTDAFELGLRGEYFAESATGAGAIGAYDEDGNANVIDLTLSGNVHLGDLTLIPEIRGDFTSEEAFVDKDGEATNSLFSLQVAAVYGF